MSLAQFVNDYEICPIGVQVSSVICYKLLRFYTRKQFHSNPERFENGTNGKLDSWLESCFEEHQTTQTKDNLVCNGFSTLTLSFVMLKALKKTRIQS